MDHYVPMLIAALQSPLDVGAQYTIDPFGTLSVRHTVYRENAAAGLTTSLTMGLGTAFAFVPSGPVDVLHANRPPFNDMVGEVTPAQANSPAFKDALVALSKQYAMLQSAVEERQNAATSARIAVEDAAALSEAVDRANSAIAQQNARVTDVLSKVTGHADLGSDPVRWADWWWNDYNESYLGYGGNEVTGDAKPNYHDAYFADSRSTCTIPYLTDPPMHVVFYSCFAPGTRVWTLIGLVPIEQIKVGDPVLSQDPESGELAYKPVLDVTQRPAGPRANVTVGTETITATPGHPFWIVGQGWRLTKQLKPGERFHTLSGGTAITAFEKLDADEAKPEPAYNLVVADFNTYFVGEHGILVHDNTPRRPTAAIVPGLIPSTRYVLAAEGQ